MRVVSGVAQWRDREAEDKNQGVSSFVSFKLSSEVYDGTPFLAHSQRAAAGPLPAPTPARDIVPRISDRVRAGGDPDELHGGMGSRRSAEAAKGLDESMASVATGLGENVFASTSSIRMGHEMSGSDMSASGSERAEDRRAVAATAAGTRAEGMPLAAGESSAAPAAAAAAAPAFSLEEAMRVRQKLADMQQQVMQLQGERDNSDRALRKRASELEVCRSRYAGGVPSALRGAPAPPPLSASWYTHVAAACCVHAPFPQAAGDAKAFAGGGGGGQTAEGSAGRAACGAQWGGQDVVCCRRGRLRAICDGHGHTCALIG
ncbi:hypothetical protein EON66_04450 [archaeon]|nr:MAG: hypothetical protein EON66_04450 [archaeon]